MSFTPVVIFTNVFSMPNFIQYVKELDKQLEKTYKALPTPFHFALRLEILTAD
jgi:hypothetical protein